MIPHWTSFSANYAPGLCIFIYPPWPGLKLEDAGLGVELLSGTDNQEHGVMLITPQTSQFPWLLLSSISSSLLEPGGLLHHAAVCPLPSLLESLSWPCLACISQAPLWLLPHTASLLWNVLAPARTPPPPAPEDLGSLLCTASSRKGSPCVPSG